MQVLAVCCQLLVIKRVCCYPEVLKRLAMAAGAAALAVAIDIPSSPSAGALGAPSSGVVPAGEPLSPHTPTPASKSTGPSPRKQQPKAKGNKGSGKARQCLTKSTGKELQGKKLGKTSGHTSFFSKLDDDGDGDFDFDDLQEWVEADVEPGTEAQEDKIEHWPIFVITQCLLAFGFWAVFALQDPDFMYAKGGLDNLYPGSTQMQVHEDCKDLRVEFWRWVLYQYTHANFSHVGLNCLLVLCTGVYLEANHGWKRVFLVFNLGVLGGAFNFAIFDAHSHLVGMSGGCYALIGMNLANLVMNWYQMKSRYAFALILFVLMVLDVVNVLLDHGESGVSHDAHIGGYSVGVVAGVLLADNIKSQWYERYVWIASLGIGLSLFAFGVAWTAQWPPRTIWDMTPWCYARQVYNETLFEGFKYSCIRCQNDACVKEYSSMPYINKVSFRFCSDEAGWSYSQ
eukprot:TRINITY_DN112763_c0_g1_i1.p1 TRINITY_DN112763_c0_g1~~TRINITY_DN112763_c0_g1_i1.p1  ORF type:complete len:455 (-),score=43.12 TRINITY_DN112763_c0_g1_i1:52-1416(-)